MSRIGKQPILIPDKTEVKLSGMELSVKGPLGVLKRNIHPDIKADIKDGEINVIPSGDSAQINALWGTYASHINNMVQGVNKFFEKKLIIDGIGYKWEVNGDKLVLNIGFSHQVELNIPSDIKVVAEKNNLTVTGINKETVGQFAAKVRLKKKAEPYKGKGIRYIDEIIRRKQGKKSA